MRKWLPILALFCCSGVMATQQIREVFIVEGETYRTYTNPLESLHRYEDIRGMLQTHHWCTANWRGYLGTWEVKDNQLYVKSLVEGACQDKPRLADPVVFFGEKQYPVMATWFNDKIEVMLGGVQILNCKTASGRSLQYGTRQEIMVYEFAAGRLIHKAKQAIEHLYRENCEP